MMWRMVMIVAIALLAVVAEGGSAGAAKKPGKAAPKPLYEAPMRVVVVRSSEGACEPLCPQWIAAEGEITSATPAAFRKVFKQIGDRKLPVIIRSPGGSIQAAVEIGRMIRKRGLEVSLGFTDYAGCAPDAKGCKLLGAQKGVYRGVVVTERAFCNSACHLVLAGGARRLAPAGTFVGVHQPKTVWTREIVTYRERYRVVNGLKKVVEKKIISRKPGKARVTFGYDKRLRKLLLAYYADMGVDPQLLKESEKAKNSSINQLSLSELDAFRLRTSTANADSLVSAAVCKQGTRPNCVAAP